MTATRYLTTLREMLKDTRFSIGAGIFLFLFVLICLTALSPFDPNDWQVVPRDMPPSWEHPLGTTMERIERALNAVGLHYDDIAHRYPGEFSGGQLQRISIARALLTQPPLLVADEPVSMVDASLRMSIVNLFEKIRDEFGISVIYITHDLATAYYVCGRIAVMFRGNVVEMGEVEKVLMDPKHPYTALLRESIPEPDPERRWSEKMKLAESEREEYLRVGCKFAGRCPHAMDKCRQEMPQDIEVDGVLVKCSLYD